MDPNPLTVKPVQADPIGTAETRPRWVWPDPEIRTRVKDPLGMMPRQVREDGAWSKPGADRPRCGSRHPGAGDAHDPPDAANLPLLPRGGGGPESHPRTRAGYSLTAGGVAVLAIAAAMLFASGPAVRVTPSQATTGTRSTVFPAVPSPGAVPLSVPAPLSDPTLPLTAGPVPVPLELRIPSIALNATTIGVGLTPANVMDAPTGAADDPVWQQAYWYRGSAVPGAPSTALIAAHVNDSVGRPGPFAEIGTLAPGALIVTHDTRTGRDISFSVTETQSYPVSQTTDPDVLTRVYGVGPVAGTRPQISDDGLAHLTLITCTGDFKNGTHDRRLVVYATRLAAT